MRKGPFTTKNALKKNINTVPEVDPESNEPVIEEVKAPTITEGAEPEMASVNMEVRPRSPEKDTSTFALTPLPSSVL